MPYLYLAAAIIFEVSGTLALKWSAITNNQWYSAITFISYCVSFFFLWLALKNLPLALSYATWSGVGIAATCLLGVFFFAEKIDTMGLIGVTLIISGIILINFYSSMSGH